MKNLDFELLTDEFMLQTIGFSNLNKLLFTSAHLKKRCHCETSAHTGRGNPPVRGEMFRKAPENGGCYGSWR